MVMLIKKIQYWNSLKVGYSIYLSFNLSIAGLVHTHKLNMVTTAATDMQHGCNAIIDHSVTLIVF